MSSIESYDGLCGIIANFASSSLQLRCQYEMGHGGPCSFEKYKKHFRITGGIFILPDPEREFINSVVNHNYRHDPIVISSMGKIGVKL